MNLLSGWLLLTSIFKRQSGLTFVNTPTEVALGDTVTLTWTGGNLTDVYTITLVEGPANNLNTIETITTSASEGQYVWTVDTSLTPADDYALRIQQGDETNYAGEIVITGSSSTGGSGSTPTSASGTGTTESSTSSSSPTSSTSSSTAASTSSTPSSITSASSTLSSATSRSTSPSTTSTSTTPSSTSTSPTPTPAPSSGGLSTGAKAAIGVCVPVGVIALVAGAFFIGRRARGAKASTETPAAAADEKKAEYPKNTTELEVRSPGELWTAGNTAEMEGTQHVRPHELPGSPV